MDTSRYTSLKHISLFQDLSETELKFLLHRAVKLHYAPGQSIFVEGDPCEGLYHSREQLGSGMMLAQRPFWPDLKKTGKMQARFGFCANLYGLVAGLLFVTALQTRVASLDYTQIEKAIQAGHLAVARQELERRIKVDPDDYQAQVLLGIVLDEQGESRVATVHFKIAERLRPNDPQIHVNLGKHDASLGNLIAARDEFTEAIRLNPRDSTAHNDLGLILLKLREPREALLQFLAARRGAPEDREILLNLFKTELVLRMFMDARRTSLEIAKSSSSPARDIAELGALQAEAGDYQGAIENLSQAHQFNPQSYKVAYNLGLAYYRAGQLQRAIQILKAEQQRHDTAEVENLLADALEKSGSYLDAVRAYQMATKLDPANESYWYDYLLELLKHKTFDAATLVAEPVVQRFPSSTRLLLALGVAYFGNGHYEQALKTFMEAARRFPDQGLPLYFLALTVELTGQETQQTAELLSGFSRAHPNAFWPYYFLGQAAYQSELASGGNDFQRATELLKRSIELNPDFADSHLALGILYSQVHNWPSAAEEFRKAIKLNPELAVAHYRLAEVYRRLGQNRSAATEEQVFQRLRAREAQQGLAQQQTQRFLYNLPQ